MYFISFVSYATSRGLPASESGLIAVFFGLEKRWMDMYSTTRALHRLSRQTNVFCRNISTDLPKKKTGCRPIIFGSIIAGVGLGGYYFYQTSNDRISPFYWTPLTISSVEKISHDTSIIRLALPRDQLPLEDSTGKLLGQLEHNEIKSLYLMQPDVQIQRPYTPLDDAVFYSNGPHEVDLLVKRYGDGEMSRWLHGLQPGSTVKVRGPVLTWAFPTDKYDEIVFIAGGTGLTPAYQLIQKATTLQKGPKIKLLYSSISPEDIYLKNSLQHMAETYPERICVDFFVDSNPARPTVSWKEWIFGSPQVIEDTTVGRLDEALLTKHIGGPTSRRLVVLCGPDSMLAALAGPKTTQPTPLSGVLGKMGYTSKQVIKLE